MENLIKFTTFLNHSTLLEPAGCRLAEEISQGRRVKRALSYLAAIMAKDWMNRFTSSGLDYRFGRWRLCTLAGG